MTYPRPSSFGPAADAAASVVPSPRFPDIERDFHGTPISELSWVLNAYNIVFAAFLVAAGRLSREALNEAVAAVPRHVAERELVLPLMRRGEALVVAMSEPWDHHLLDELRFMTQLRIVPVMAAPGTLLPAIDRA